MELDGSRPATFTLSPEFLDAYRERPVPWGFGPLSWVTYKRTYSRNGEEWWQTCRRVIEGMFTVQRMHCRQFGLSWDDERAHEVAQRAYDRLWRFKWTPPGRGLWIMGTDFIFERGGAALNNCGFVSTRDLASDYADPFVWMLTMSMVGVGVGFDTRGKGSVRVKPPVRGRDVHVIKDSREGWAEALRRLLESFVGRNTLPAAWDYSQIRPAGEQLSSFGGTASGPAPLKFMLESLEALYTDYISFKADARLIVDTMNMIGRCVVAGGIRRSAQVAFGDPQDKEFLDLKQDQEKVRQYRWASNNSVFAEVGMDYNPIAERSAVNGEPGYLWLDNVREFGRLKDPPNALDQNAMGSNPCVEQSLWDRELCCLVETYPAHHESRQDYEETLRLAYQYAKTVTLVPSLNKQTNEVMKQNRRIGCSMSGVVQAINKLGYRRFFNWCDCCYDFIQELDRQYSDWLKVPASIKTTSVKPSGTVSILAGATPGVHWEHAPYYIRRLRLSENHPLAKMCADAEYPVEQDVYADNTVVVSFPVKVRNPGRRKADVSLWEKVDLAAQMQWYWSDNQVSCTGDFNPESERGELPRLLSAYENRLKAIVFLPQFGHGYAQPPYEEIEPTTYEEMISKLKPLKGTPPHEEQLEARFCEGSACEMP